MILGSMILKQISVVGFLWPPYLKKIFAVEWKYFNKYDYKKEISIHIFTDTSIKGYGAIAYFKYIYTANEIKASFTLSKTRVLRIKTLIYPCLELMAAVIGARIYNYKLFNDI